MAGKALKLLAADSLPDFFSPVVEAAKARGHVVEPWVQGRPLADADLADVSVMLGAPWTPVDAAMIAAAPVLRGIVSIATGTEGFDEQAASDAGVLVANGHADAISISMAESTILLVLAALFDLPGNMALLRGDSPAWQPGRTLHGKSLGLIGFGAIARVMAERLKNWGVEIGCYTPRLRAPLPGHVRRLDLDELMARSDVICVLCNLSTETEGMIDARRLALTKPGAVFVNTARGAIVEEAELCRLSAAGHFSRIALDTYQVEPLPAESPLRQLPNAILTPHTVGHTEEAVAGAVQCAEANVIALLEGHLPPCLRNPDIAARWLTRWGASA